MALPEDWVTQLAAHIADRGLVRRPVVRHPSGHPISRNTFRTRVWRPAVAASGVDFEVPVHDLRYAHASWLLAGGPDVKSVMGRMGHAQITTTTQKYLHTLPDADTKNLTALDRFRGKRADRSADGTGQAG